MGDLFKNEYFKVGFGLVIGLGIIIYNFPPVTVCDGQQAVYDKGVMAQVKAYNKDLKLCKKRTGPGGCIGFFEVTHKIEQQIKKLSSQCQANLINDKKTRELLTMSLEVFARVAWGSEPPAQKLDKNGWLELPQLVQYCRTKALYIEIFGEEAFNALADRVLADLPGNQQLGRNETWNRSLLSDRCQYNL